MTTSQTSNSAAPQSGWSAYCAAARALQREMPQENRNEIADDSRR
jgi:hypothetical protein